MRTLSLLLAFTALPALAQTSQELLQMAEQNYKSLAGYEIIDAFAVQLPGSALPLNGDVTVAALPQSLEAGRPRGPAVRPMLRFGPANKNASIALTLDVFGGWDKMAENVATVTEVGAETLQLNGLAVPCRILEVNYKPHPYVEGHNPTITFSICSDKHLVLRKSLDAPANREGGDSPAQWNLTFTSAEFGVAPDWLLARQPQPALSTRQDWIGRAAPDFTLTQAGRTSRATFGDAR